MVISRGPLVQEFSRVHLEISNLYTFFLTGCPKGAMLTHRNIVSNMSAFVKATEVKVADLDFFEILECNSFGKEVINLLQK